MAQSLAKIYLHLVFSTKNRQPSLCDQWREEAFTVLGGMANRLGCQSITVGGMADHVHMLFQQGRTITVADAVKNIKLGSSKWINETRGVTQPFYWQSGYGIFSVSHSQLDIVRESIYSTNPYIMRNVAFKMNYADFSNATPSNGMNDMFGIEL